MDTENKEEKTGVVGEMLLSLTVGWKEGTTEEEKERHQEWIGKAIREINDDAEDLPACVESLLIKRN